MNNLYSTLIYWVPAILLALTVHEYSHARVAYAFGDNTAKFQGRLTLNPIKHLDPVGTLLLIIAHFGWAKPVPVNPYNFKGDRRKGLMWVSLAGPGSNVLLALISAILLRLFYQHWYLGEFLNALFQINIILAIFNLLPVPPLDGSKILAGIIPARYGHVIYNLERFGPLILLLLVVTGLTSYLILPPAIFLSNLILNLVSVIF